MDDWQPLEGTLLGDSTDALYDGVPDWLVSSLRGWVKPKLTWRTLAGGGRSAGYVTKYATDVMHEMELRLRTTFSWSSDGATVVSVLNKAVEEPEVFLGVVDLLVHRLRRSKTHDDGNIKALERVLRLGGSAWKVNDDENPQLVRRVDATYEAAAGKAMKHGKAGRLILAAWTAAYGREPQASHAYQQAVRAVEAAAQPVILPASDKATLGQIIPAIKDKPDKWQTPIAPPDVVSLEVVAEMMQLLWRGQHDRHGTVDEAGPLHVELEETLAALPIAVALVELFSSGSVRPRST